MYDHCRVVIIRGYVNFVSVVFKGAAKLVIQLVDLNVFVSNNITTKITHV